LGAAQLGKYQKVVDELKATVGTLAVRNVTRVRNCQTAAFFRCAANRSSSNCSVAICSVTAAPAIQPKLPEERRARWKLPRSESPAQPAIVNRPGYRGISRPLRAASVVSLRQNKDPEGQLLELAVINWLPARRTPFAQHNKEQL
jgi:hypothetical protein